MKKYLIVITLIFIISDKINAQANANNWTWIKGSCTLPTNDNYYRRKLERPQHVVMWQSTHLQRPCKHWAYYFRFRNWIL
jgi:hypothetical protein